MALTKTDSVLFNDVAQAAGGSNTSSGEDLTGSYGAVVYLRNTNGATGPTVANSMTVEVSNDNSGWYDLGGKLTARNGNSDIDEWFVEIPLGVKYVRVSSTGNTGQGVTIRAVVTKVTAL